MDTQPALGFTQVLTHIAGDIAKAVSERSGETPRQRNARSEAAVYMVLGFLPRDVIEAMVGGHCVLLHELMVDSVRHTLTGEMATTRRATRGGIVAMDKAFGANLTRLEHYRQRPLVGVGDEAPKDVPDCVPMDVAAADAPVDALADVAVEGSEAAMPVEANALSKPETSVPLAPTAAAIAACRANPEAMAALDAGDPERFARAMGIEQPSEAFLEAATAPGGPFDRSVPANHRSLASRVARSGDGSFQP